MSMDSMAGTSAQYFGGEQFRIRRVGGMFRIHIPQSYVRHREKYVALDVPVDVVLEGIVKSME